MADRAAARSFPLQDMARPLSVVVAPDSFKGSLSAPEAAAAITAGIARGAPGATAIQRPDGRRRRRHARRGAACFGQCRESGRDRGRRRGRRADPRGLRHRRPRRHAHRDPRVRAGRRDHRCGGHGGSGDVTHDDGPRPATAGAARPRRAPLHGRARRQQHQRRRRGTAGRAGAAAPRCRRTRRRANARRTRAPRARGCFGARCAPRGLRDHDHVRRRQSARRRARRDGDLRAAERGGGRAKSPRSTRRSRAMRQSSSLR